MHTATTPPTLYVPLRPHAAPDAIIHAGNARFTVLTSRLIRLEYGTTAQFEDRASAAFWYRDQPVPLFEWRQTDDGIEIITDALHLRYNGAFSAQGLTITLRAGGEVWHYGKRDPRNLGGTMRGLDQIANKHVALEQGLISRSGWAVVDDSRSYVLDENAWLTLRDGSDNLDLYFFGYGHDYKAALADFARISGEVPLLPRWALGNWWSRYWKYDDAELRALVRRFQEEAIPLSVFVIDMDWHITQTGNGCSGWTGYTWNKSLFPDPPALIGWMHAQGLRTCLNVHPAEGVWDHEASYPAMAQALGIDPASRQPLPFAIHDPRFVAAYLDYLHRPQESIGIDFWWLDWQHDTYAALPQIDPLLWLNHVHATDLSNRAGKRPFLVSRWGGLGNHRYPMGFSGDTYVTWEMLAYLPYFTATAANVNYGWWSHDIGGHFYGLQEAELYLRWVQFGVLNPIMRLHSSNNPYEERHPWGFGDDILRQTREMMRFRHQLIPYLYTMAKRNQEAALPLVTPMYYDHPDHDEAYCAINQYMLGSDLLAAPHLAKRDEHLGLSRQVAWLPDGDWYDFFTGEHYAGGTWHAVYGGLDDVPLFARAGAIIPLATPEGGLGNPDHLDLHVFAGANGAFTLYEDDGESEGWRDGLCSRATFSQTINADTLTLTIGAAEGDTAHLPPQRHYRVVAHGIHAPANATVAVNGGTMTFYEGDYDAQAEAYTLEVGALTLQDSLTLTLRFGGAVLSRRDRRRETCLKMLRAFKMDNVVKQRIELQLDAILAQPTLLLRDFVLVNDVQLRALLEVITGAGAAHFDSATESDTLVVWSHHDSADAQFIWSTWNFEQRFGGSGGVAPRSWVAQVDHDRQWKLRLSYCGLHTVTYQNAYLDYRPGSTEAWLEGGFRQLQAQANAKGG